MPRFIYNDIGGGLNQGQPPQTLADREWVSHVNFYPRGTKLRRRGGLRRMVTSAHSERLTGVLAYRPTTGSVQTLLGARTAICELMDLTDRIRDMILDRRPTSEIKKAAKDEGMTFLRECAVGLVLGGVTTLREINKVTFVE